MIKKEDFIKFYENHSDMQTRKQFKISKEKLLKLLKEFDVQRHSKLDNTHFTCLEKYGVEHHQKTEGVKQKSKQTKKEHFGKENYVNFDKIKETNLRKYGMEWAFQVDTVKDKIKDTLVEKYGVENAMYCEDLKSKQKNTCLEKYGVENVSYLQEVKNKISTSNKGKVRTDAQKQHLREVFTGKHLSKEKLKIKLTKEYITKKKNNSFNTSKPEELLYEQLLQENKTKTIYRQYKDDERYPFYCDFYIVEDDLFIELNAHWTHGGKPFNANDKECLDKLALWQEKAKTSQFYKNAIKTWTIRDVAKAKCAKENNLNYKVIY